MTEMRTTRLIVGDVALARGLFTMMSEVFAEESTPLSDRYLERLLRRDDFWAFAALVGDVVVGGITAHTLPMTRTESAEVFVYDVAVHRGYQRQGVGRRLMSALCEATAAAGIQAVIVPADNDDVHALDFYRAVGGEPSLVTFFTFRA